VLPPSLATSLPPKTTQKGAESLPGLAQTMSFLNKLRASKAEESQAAPATTDDLEIQRAPETTVVNEKNPDGTAADGDLKPDLELPEASAQRGVQKIEAVTLTWTKKELAALLGL
jgi:hypothetical protein